MNTQLRVGNATTLPFALTKVKSKDTKFYNKEQQEDKPVSYTHLTLPTKLEV